MTSEFQCYPIWRAFSFYESYEGLGAPKRNLYSVHLLAINMTPMFGSGGPNTTFGRQVPFTAPYSTYWSSRHPLYHP
jgi:hypothetical protein